MDALYNTWSNMYTIFSYSITFHNDRGATNNAPQRSAIVRCAYQAKHSTNDTQTPRATANQANQSKNYVEQMRRNEKEKEIKRIVVSFNRTKRIHWPRLDKEMKDEKKPPNFTRNLCSFI